MTRNMNKVRVSDGGSTAMLRQSRRSFLPSVAAGVACSIGLPGLLRAAAHGASALTLPKATRELLTSSPYVYISPLKMDGEESRCHGEVWYAWIDGAVVVTVASDRSIGRRRPRDDTGDHRGRLADRVAARRACADMTEVGAAQPVVD